VLDAEPSSGQLGQHLWVALAGDQRLQHGRPETPKMSVATVPSLIRASSSSLLQPLLVAGAVGGQVGTQPGVLPQPADLGGRTNEGRSMPRSFSLHHHTASSLSVLGRPGRCSGVTGVDRPHHQPPRLQQVHERPPILGGGLDHDPLDPLPGQLLG